MSGTKFEWPSINLVCVCGANKKLVDRMNFRLLTKQKPTKGKSTSSISKSSASADTWSAQSVVRFFRAAGYYKYEYKHIYTHFHQRI